MYSTVNATVQINWRSLIGKGKYHLLHNIMQHFKTLIIKCNNVATLLQSFIKQRKRKKGYYEIRLSHAVI